MVSKHPDRRGRFSTLTAAVAAGVLGFPSLGFTQSDQWSIETELRIGTDYFAPVHATLLPSGDVMMIGFTQTMLSPTSMGGTAAICDRTGTTTALFTPAPLGTPVPSSVALSNTYPESVAYPASQYCYPDGACGGTTCRSDTYFCSGHTLLDDGNLLLVGGLRQDYALPGYGAAGGTDYSAIWDWQAPALTAQWSMVPGSFSGVPSGAYTQGIFTGHERYYPTAMRLHTGEVMIIGGSQVLAATGWSAVRNLVADVFSPATSTYASIATEAPVEAFNVDYTHTFVLPAPVSGNDVILLGDDAVPVLLDLDATMDPWTVQTKQVGEQMVPDVRPPGPGLPMVPDPNKGGSTVMLPIRLTSSSFGYANGSILTAGGQKAPEQTQGYGDFIDIYDVVDETWTTQLPLQKPRHHPSTVLLPDGQVLFVCGHTPASTTPLPQQAEYLSLRGNYGTTLGTIDPNLVPRGYHTITVLLPDGRVLVGGGRNAGSSGSSALERGSVQYLSPPYMFRPRPTITSWPRDVSYGDDTFQLRGKGPISEVVLVGLGSMTHSIDMNQRHVQLRILHQAIHVQTGQYLAIVRGPAQGRVAPPGYYMLFVLAGDAKRTPSEARIVRVQ